MFFLHALAGKKERELIKGVAYGQPMEWGEGRGRREAGDETTGIELR